MRIAIAGTDRAMIEALRHVIASAPQHELVWIAHGGADAVRRCGFHRPDVLLMGLAHPDADAIEATRTIMRETPCGIIVVTTSVQRDTAAVFAAMGAGALDVVAVPAVPEKKGKALATQILQKIRMVGMLSTPPMPVAAAPQAAVPPDLALVAIGASAGGPPAIACVLRDLPENIRAAIVVVQHIDAKFSESMATWFDTQTSLHVRIARSNQPLEAGVVYLASGDQHLVLSAALTLAYAAEPRRCPYRPSADVLFDSIARHWPGTAIGIILSGMGSDGAAGLHRLRHAGARTIAQDQSTSAVYGMPRAAALTNAATDILPLPAIGPLVRELLHARRATRSASAS